MYDRVRADDGGAVADYIPQLKRVDPEKFGIAVCTVDGQRFSIGDTGDLFCVQSVCKPINYCLALEEHGVAAVHRHVGREPSGRGFNELSLTDDGLPHNPMINSGAIMSLFAAAFPRRARRPLRPRGRDMAQALRLGQSRLQQLGLSVRAQTADRNFALGYFMRENGAFPEGTDLVETLEFYFQCCSIELDAQRWPSSPPRSPTPASIP